MSLSGGAFVPINKDVKPFQIGPGAGKTFIIGESLSSDWIIENGGKSMKYCELCIDSFGRVTITNHCKDETQPLKVNGVEIKKATRLLNGQKVHILQEEYVWTFDNLLNSHRRLSSDDRLQTTPDKTDIITEENAYSEPNLRRFTKFISRLTMGNLKNWTNTNTSGNESPEKSSITDDSDIINDISITECNSSPTGCKSPKQDSLKEVEKENYTPNKSYNVVLNGRSATVITSYSPAIENAENYATVVTYGTPQSVYSTPNKDEEALEFSTPNISTNSMHLMDLTTTPRTKAPDTPTSSGRYTAVQGFSSSPIVLSDTDTSSDVVSVPSSNEPKSPEQCAKKTTALLQSGATPKRTPQSLMKRAILTSAKKAGHTPASRRSLLGVSEKSLSIVRRVPQLTPRMNKLTEDRLNLSLKNMEEQKSPLFSTARKSLSNLRWTPDKKRSPPRKSMSAVKATPEAIKILSRKSMSAKPLASRKSMFCGSVKSTPKPSISALRKSMVALSKSKTPTTSTAVKKPSLNDTCDMEGIAQLMKTPKPSTSVLKKPSFDDTCDMEGISELMKTPSAPERSRTFIVDTPADKVFNSSLSKNLMMAMSPNDSMNVGSDICTDTLEEINTTVDVNSTIEISGIGDDLIKEGDIGNEPEVSDPTEEENASIVQKSMEPNDPLLLSAIKDADSNLNRSEVSIAKPTEDAVDRANRTIGTVNPKDPLETTMSASMSGIGILEDSNESEMAEKLIVSDNEEEGDKSCPKTPTVTEAKELMKTPAAGQIEDLQGVKELLQTPKAPPKTPMLRGVREMFTCQVEMNSPDMRGIKETMQDPKEPTTPMMRGVKELMRTPRVTASTPLMKGIKNLMQTPKEEPCSPILKGIKEMMNTKKDAHTPEMRGVKNLMKTPASRTPNVKGVSEMFKTPAKLPVIEEPEPVLSPNLFEESLSNAESLKVTDDVPEMILQLSNEEEEIISANESLMFDDSDDRPADVDEDALLEGAEIDHNISPEDEKLLLESSSSSECGTPRRECEDSVNKRLSVNTEEEHSVELPEFKEEVDIGDYEEESLAGVTDCDDLEKITDQPEVVPEESILEASTNQTTPRRLSIRRSFINSPASSQTPRRRSIMVKKVDEKDELAAGEQSEKDVVGQSEETAESEETTPITEVETVSKRLSTRKSFTNSPAPSRTPRRKSTMAEKIEEAPEGQTSDDDKSRPSEEEVVEGSESMSRRLSIRRSFTNSPAPSKTPRRKSTMVEKVDEKDELSTEEQPSQDIDKADQSEEEIIPESQSIPEAETVSRRLSIRRSFNNSPAPSQTPRRKSTFVEKIEEKDELPTEEQPTEDKPNPSAEKIVPSEEQASDVHKTTDESEQENISESEQFSEEKTRRLSTRMSMTNSPAPSKTPARKSMVPEKIQEKDDSVLEEESSDLDKTTNESQREEADIVESTLIPEEEPVSTRRLSSRQSFTNSPAPSKTPRRKSTMVEKIEEKDDVPTEEQDSDNVEETTNVNENEEPEIIAPESDQVPEAKTPTTKRLSTRMSFANSPAPSKTPGRKSMVAKKIEEKDDSILEEESSDIDKPTNESQREETDIIQSTLISDAEPVSTRRLSSRKSFTNSPAPSKTPRRKSIVAEKIEEKDDSVLEEVASEKETIPEESVSEETSDNLNEAIEVQKQESLPISQAETISISEEDAVIVSGENTTEFQETENENDPSEKENSISQDPEILDESRVQPTSRRLSIRKSFTNSPMTTQTPRRKSRMVEKLEESVQEEDTNPNADDVTEDVTPDAEVENSILEESTVQTSSRRLSIRRSMSNAATPRRKSMRVVEEVLENTEVEEQPEVQHDATDELLEAEPEQSENIDIQEESIPVEHEDVTEMQRSLEVEEDSEVKNESVAQNDTAVEVESEDQDIFESSTTDEKVVSNEPDQDTFNARLEISKVLDDNEPKSTRRSSRSSIGNSSLTVKTPRRKSIKVVEETDEIEASAAETVEEQVSEEADGQDSEVVVVPELDDEENHADDSTSVVVPEEPEVSATEEPTSEEMASEEPTSEEIASEEKPDEADSEDFDKKEKIPAITVTEDEKQVSTEEQNQEETEEVIEKTPELPTRRSIRRRSVTNSPLVIPSKTPRRKSVQIIMPVVDETKTATDVDPQNEPSTSENNGVLDLELSVNTKSEVDADLFEASVVFDLKTPKRKIVSSEELEDAPLDTISETDKEEDQHLENLIVETQAEEVQDLNDTPNNMSIVFTPHRAVRKRSTTESPLATKTPARKISKRNESTIIEETEAEEVEHAEVEEQIQENVEYVHVEDSITEVDDQEEEEQNLNDSEVIETVPGIDETQAEEIQDLNDTPNNMSIVFTPHRPLRKRSTTESPLAAKTPSRKASKRNESTIFEEDEEDQDNAEPIEVEDSLHENDESETVEVEEPLQQNEKSLKVEEPLLDDSVVVEEPAKSVSYNDKEQEEIVESTQEVSIHEVEEDQEIGLQVSMEEEANEKEDDVVQEIDHIDSSKEMESLCIDEDDEESNEIDSTVNTIHEEQAASEEVNSTNDIESLEISEEHIIEVDSDEVAVIDSTEPRENEIPPKEEEPSQEVVSTSEDLHESDVPTDFVASSEDVENDDVLEKSSEAECEEVDSTSLEEGSTQQIDVDLPSKEDPEIDSTGVDLEDIEPVDSTDNEEVEPLELHDSIEQTEEPYEIDSTNVENKDQAVVDSTQIDDNVDSLNEAVSEESTETSDSSNRVDNRATPLRSTRTRTFNNSPMPSRTPRRKVKEPIVEEIVDSSNVSEEKTTDETSDVQPELTIATPRRQTRKGSFTNSPMPSRTPRRKITEPVLEESSEKAEEVVDLKDAPILGEPSDIAEVVVERKDKSEEEHTSNAEDTHDENVESEKDDIPKPDVQELPAVQSIINENALTPRRSTRKGSFTNSPMPTRTPRRKAAKPILEEASEKSESVVDSDLTKPIPEESSEKAESVIDSEADSKLTENASSNDETQVETLEIDSEVPDASSLQKSVVEPEESSEKMESDLDVAPIDTESKIQEPSAIQASTISESSTPRRTTRKGSFSKTPIPSRTPRRRMAKTIPEEELSSKKTDADDLVEIDPTESEPSSNQPTTTENNEAQAKKKIEEIDLTSETASEESEELVAEASNQEIFKEESSNKEASTEKQFENIDLTTETADSEVKEPSSNDEVSTENLETPDDGTKKKEFRSIVLSDSSEEEDKLAEDDIETISNTSAAPISRQLSQQSTLTNDDFAYQDDEIISISSSQASSLVAEHVKKTDSSDKENEKPMEVVDSTSEQTVDPLTLTEENEAQESSEVQNNVPVIEVEEVPDNIAEDSEVPEIDAVKDSEVPVEKAPAKDSDIPDVEKVKDSEVPVVEKSASKDSEDPVVEAENGAPKPKEDEASEIASDDPKEPVQPVVEKASSEKETPHNPKKDVLKSSTSKASRNRKRVPEEKVEKTRIFPIHITGDMDEETILSLTPSRRITSDPSTPSRAVESKVETPGTIERAKRIRKIPQKFIDSVESPGKLTPRRTQKEISENTSNEKQSDVEAVIPTTLEVPTKKAPGSEVKTGRKGAKKVESVSEKTPSLKEQKEIAVRETLVVNQAQDLGTRLTPEKHVVFDLPNMTPTPVKSKGREVSKSRKGKNESTVPVTSSKTLESPPHRITNRRKPVSDLPIEQDEVPIQVIEDQHLSTESSKTGRRANKRALKNVVSSPEKEPLEEPKAKQGRKKVEAVHEDKTSHSDNVEPTAVSETKTKGKGTKKESVPELTTLHQEQSSAIVESITPSGTKARNARKKADDNANAAAVPEQPQQEVSVEPKPQTKARGGRKKVEDHHDEVSSVPTETQVEELPQENTVESTQPKGRGGRKKVEEPSVTKDSQSTPIAEPKKTQRGRKNVQEVPEVVVQEEPPTAEEPSSEAQNRGRSRKVEEVATASVESEPTPKGRGRKKDTSIEPEIQTKRQKIEEEHHEPHSTATAELEPKTKGRGGRRKVEEHPEQPSIDSKVSNESIAVEPTPTPIESESKPKGRGGRRKAVDTHEEPALEVHEEKAVEPEPEVRLKGRGGRKKVDELHEEPVKMIQEEIEKSAKHESDVKPKGRGGRKNVAETHEETAVEVHEEKEVEPEPEVKPKGRGGRRKAAEVHEETVAEVSEEKEAEPEPEVKPKGRGGRRKAAEAHEEPSKEVHEEKKVEPEPEVKPKGRGGRRKAAEAQEEPSKEVHEEKKVEPEPEVKPKGRGGRRKAAEAHEEPSKEVHEEKKVEPEPEVKPKGRGGRNKPAEAHEEPVAEVSEEKEVEPEPEVKPKGRGGRKKPAEAHEEPSTELHEEKKTTAEPEPEVKPKGRGGRTKATESHEEPVAEVHTENVASVELEPEVKPKGRAARKKAAEAHGEPATEVQVESVTLVEPEPEVKPKGRGGRRKAAEEPVAEVHEENVASVEPEPEIKPKGRGGRKKAAEEPVPESTNSVEPEPETKPKGRGGRKKADEVHEEPVADSTASVETVQEIKPKARGGRKKATEVHEEPALEVQEEEVTSVEHQEKPKGRGGRKKAPEVHEEPVPEPESKSKGRNRKKVEEAQEASSETDKQELPVEPQHEDPKPRRGRKNVEETSTAEEVQEKPDTKRGGKKADAVVTAEESEESKTKKGGRRKADEVVELPAEVPSKRLRKNSHQVDESEEKTDDKKGRKKVDDTPVEQPVTSKRVRVAPAKLIEEGEMMKKRPRRK